MGFRVGLIWQFSLLLGENIEISISGLWWLSNQMSWDNLALAHSLVCHYIKQGYEALSNVCLSDD